MDAFPSRLGPEQLVFPGDMLEARYPSSGEGDRAPPLRSKTGAQGIAAAFQRAPIELVGIDKGSRPIAPQIALEKNEPITIFELYQPSEGAFVE